MKALRQKLISRGIVEIFCTIRMNASGRCEVALYEGNLNGAGAVLMIRRFKVFDDAWRFLLRAKMACYSMDVDFLY